MNDPKKITKEIPEGDMSPGLLITLTALGSCLIAFTTTKSPQERERYKGLIQVFIGDATGNYKEEVNEILKNI